RSISRVNLHQCSQVVNIAIGIKFHATWQRTEDVALRRLPGHRQRAHGAAVETIIGGQDAPAPSQARQLEGCLIGFCTGVREDNARGIIANLVLEPLRQLYRWWRRKEVTDVAKRCHLRADRLDDRGVVSAQGIHGNTCEQIEVFISLLIDKICTVARDNTHWWGAMVIHHGVLRGANHGRIRGEHCASSFLNTVPSGYRERSKLAGRTMVPIPPMVKSSSNTACARRPSMMWEAATPPLTAFRAASIFGIMPASKPGSIFSKGVASILETNDSLFGQSVYSPSTLVSITKRSAPMAWAKAPAAESALML